MGTFLSIQCSLLWGSLQYFYYHCLKQSRFSFIFVSNGKRGWSYTIGHQLTQSHILYSLVCLSTIENLIWPTRWFWKEYQHLKYQLNDSYFLLTTLQVSFVMVLNINSLTIKLLSKKYSGLACLLCTLGRIQGIN